jgi:hypothetical protein
LASSVEGRPSATSPTPAPTARRRKRQTRDQPADRGRARSFCESGQVRPTESSARRGMRPERDRRYSWRSRTSTIVRRRRNATSKRPRGWISKMPRESERPAVPMGLGRSEASLRGRG